MLTLDLIPVGAMGGLWSRMTLDRIPVGVMGGPWSRQTKG